MKRYCSDFKIMFFVIFFFGLLGPAKSSWAVPTSWYCSNAAKGSNNGHDWDNAWECGSVVWGSSGVNVGDTLFVDGGSLSLRYTVGKNSYFPIDFDHFGAPNYGGTSDTNRITVRIGQDAGHNGVATFDAQGLYWPIFSVYGVNYVTVDGEYNGGRHFVLKNMLSAGGSGIGTVAIMTAGSKPPARPIPTGVGITLKGIEIDGAETGVYFAEMNPPGELSNLYIHNVKKEAAFRSASVGLNLGDFKIHDCILSSNVIGSGKPQLDSGSGPDIFQGVTEGWDIYRNTFRRDTGKIIGRMPITHGQHQPSIGDTITGATSGGTGKLIRYDPDPVTPGDWTLGTAKGVLSLEFNSLTWSGLENLMVGATLIGKNGEPNSPYYWTQHGDDIEGGWNKTRVYDNFFTGAPSLFQDGFEAYATGGDWADFWLYNNLITGYQNGIQVLMGGTLTNNVSRVYIVGNTFWDMKTGSGIGVANAAATVTDVQVRNNIFIDTGYNDSMTDAQCGNATYSNNVVYGTSSLNCNGKPVTNTGGKTSFPTFVNYVQGSNTGDMRLASGDTVAKDAGADLSSVQPAFAFDLLGVSRPQGAAWDIGAFEYVKGGDTTAPAAPTGLSVN